MIENFIVELLGVHLAQGILITTCFLTILYVLMNIVHKLSK